MKQPHLRQLDLNLLAALEALMAEHNVTRAAERLGVTQSAMSHMLARLRSIPLADARSPISRSASSKADAAMVEDRAERRLAAVSMGRANSLRSAEDESLLQRS